MQNTNVNGCHSEYDYDHFDVCKDKQTCYDCLLHYLKKKINDGVYDIKCPYPDHNHGNYSDQEIKLYINYDFEISKKIGKINLN